MTTASYLAGVLALACVIGPWAWAARGCVRAIAWSWPESLRALATAVIAVAGVIATALVVGTFGQFRRVPLALACVVAASAVRMLAARAAPQAADPQPDASRGELGVAGRVAIAAACIAVAQWGLSTWDALGRGIVDVDSVAYHLPQAARFVQDHATTSLHYAGANAGTAYYPANSELLHAVGMVTLRSDVVSLVVNLVFLVLGFVAAFCVGKRLGGGAASVVGFSVLAVLPLLVEFAASGYSDYTAIVFFLAAVAFALRVVDDVHSRTAVVLAGLAAGLALGTKLTLFVPVGGLTLTMWWVLRRRATDAALYSGAAVLGGAYWYVRNLVHVGNPLPNLDVGIFPSPPMSLVKRLSPAVIDVLDRRDFVFDIAPRELSRFFGIGWPLVLALVAGAIGAWLFALRRDGTAAYRAVMVGVTVTIAASAVAYLFMPTTAGSDSGHPLLFFYNLRYVLPAFIPALVVLPAVPPLRTRQAAAALVGAGLVVLALLSKPRVQLRAVLLAAALVAVVVCLRAVPRPTLRRAVAAALVVLVAAGLPLTRRYERHRFADTSTPRAALFAWGRTAPAGARVALVGLALQYPFYGPRFETRVEYLGEFRAHHEFTNIAECDAWRAALRAGHYDFVVAEPPDRVHLPPAAAWTASLPGARPVVVTRAGSVFDLRSVSAWPACD